MADRTGEGASAGDLWWGLKTRMADRQAAYRRGWLRAPIGEPARQAGGKELAFDLDLACELYLRGDAVLRREVRHSLDAWTAVRGRMLAKRGRSPISSPTPATIAGCVLAWLRSP